MGDEVRAALTELGSNLRLAPAGPADPPQLVRLRLAGAGTAHEQGMTNLLPNGLRPLVQGPAVVAAPFNLSFITKDVSFRSTALPPPPAPGADLLDAEALSDVVGGTGPGNVTGTIGRLAGTLTLPATQLVERLGEALAATVTVAITVRVRDERGGDVSGARIAFGADAAQVGARLERRDLAATAVPDFMVQLPVTFAELGRELPVTRAVVAVSVQLTATVPSLGEVRTDVIDLPELPIAVPAVPVPVLAVFFSRPDFNRDPAGRPMPLRSAGDRSEQVQLYVYVPGDSPLPDPRNSVEALLAPLEVLQRTLDALGMTTMVLGAAGLGPVVDALGMARSLAPGVELHHVVGFAKADAVEDWWDTFITFRTAGGHDTAEDKIRSIALLAPPHRVLDVFEDDDFQGSWLRLGTRTPTTGDPRALLTLVPGLESRGDPPSEPPGQVVRRRGHEPLAQRISSSRWITTA